MQEIYDDNNRQVVPRWRKFNATRESGELQPVATKKHDVTNDPTFVEKLLDWQTQPNIGFASELLSAAVVLGRQEEVRDAAEFVLANATARLSGPVGLARRILGMEPSGSSFESGRVIKGERDESRSRVRKLRSKLQNELTNAFMWVDLARAYENLGSTEKASKAMKIAMELAPTNRFVLRAASRHFLHKDDPETAHRILRKSPYIEHDPWILAAEIAVAASSGKKSRYIKLARQMIEDRAYPIFHLSELASAVGTIELDTSLLKGRRLLGISLEQPTENAIAQAAWVGRHHKVDVDSDKIQAVISAEASAHASFTSSKWDEAIEQSYNWWLDQPFSRRPTVFGSYIATVRGDDQKCVEMCNDGLIANRRDFTLLNNKALSLARLGRVKEAVKEFERIDRSKLTVEDKYVYLATHGLLCFRSGNVAEGRASYAIAKSHFVNSTVRKYAGAFLNCSLEELEIAKSERAAELKEEAMTVFGSATEPDVKMLLSRVSNFQQKLF